MGAMQTTTKQPSDANVEHIEHLTDVPKQKSKRAQPPAPRHRRPPQIHINLTGFICQPGDPEYSDAAKATGTLNHTPVYWFMEQRYAGSDIYDTLEGNATWDELEDSARNSLTWEPEWIQRQNALFARELSKPTKKRNMGAGAEVTKHVAGKGKGRKFEVMSEEEMIRKETGAKEGEKQKDEEPMIAFEQEFTKAMGEVEQGDKTTETALERDFEAAMKRMERDFPEQFAELEFDDSLLD